VAVITITLCSIPRRQPLENVNHGAVLPARISTLKSEVELQPQPTMSVRSRQKQAMITHSAQAVWELCRQGYPTSADEAEIRWSCGDTFNPDPQMHVSRTLRLLIEQCNYEVSTSSSTRH
jgi:hypothetical protein